MATIDAAQPDDPDVATRLIDAYGDAGRHAQADALVARALERWPAHPGIRLAAARHREETGHPAEALALLREHVDLDASAPAYPVYLRVLLGAERYEEALLEANRGMSSLWEPHAVLTRAVALAHFGDPRQAAELLARLDPVRYARLIRTWARALRSSGALSRVLALLDEVRATQPDLPVLSTILSAAGEVTR